MKKTPAELRRKLIFSFTFGGIFAAFVIFSVFGITHGPEREGAPRLLRGAFEWNQKVFSGLASNDRQSVKKKDPPLGKTPRVNGDLGLSDEVDLKSYSVEVESGGLKRTLHLADFTSLPKVSTTTDFRCIEGWSEIVNYEGARFSDFMERYALGKKADGSDYEYVGLETPDGEYYVSVDMKSMRHAQTVLTYEMNGKPLSSENGYPLRLIIPVKYGIKSLKRIGKIVFSDVKPHDYWAEQGYDWYSGL